MVKRLGVLMDMRMGALAGLDDYVKRLDPLGLLARQQHLVDMGLEPIPLPQLRGRVLTSA